MQLTATAPRIAIYGRHSTDKQNPSSSADQIAACQSVVQYLGGEVVRTYTDPELSGYRRDRPASNTCCATSPRAKSMSSLPNL